MPLANMIIVVVVVVIVIIIVVVAKADSVRKELQPLTSSLSSPCITQE
jgi:cell division protein FtsL